VSIDLRFPQAVQGVDGTIAMIAIMVQLASARPDEVLHSEIGRAHQLRVLLSCSCLCSMGVALRMSAWSAVKAAAASG